MHAGLRAILDGFDRERGRVCFLTGAGISAESGIPTFRGPQGYWQVGSRNYHPADLATQRAFGEHPREVWRWYLYRRTVCRRAAPNEGHHSIADLEQSLGDRLLLVTQNVDGLHARAGSNDPYEIHGNIDRYRCAAGCTHATYPFPDDSPEIDRDTPLGDALFDALRCPDCGGPARPHVLWFDECYEEALFRSASAFRQAACADLLVVIGSSGSTNLPMQIGMHCAQAGVPIIDINPIDNPFGQLAEASGGATLRAPCTDALPEIALALGPA
ncbi:MAG: SIR2 family NAD-dependent protein deacylase [Nannocystaceae bacterium]|nr:RNA polymerase subunit sigma [bacterium]